MRISDFRGQGLLGLTRRKLVPHMFFPKVAQKFLANSVVYPCLKFVIHKNL